MNMDTMETGVALPAYSEYTRFGTTNYTPSSIGGGDSEHVSSVSKSGPTRAGCWCSYAWIFLLLVLVIISLVVSNLSVYFLMKDGCRAKMEKMRESAALTEKATEVWARYQPTTPSGSQWDLRNRFSQYGPGHPNEHVNFGNRNGIGGPQAVGPRGPLRANNPGQTNQLQVSRAGGGSGGEFGTQAIGRFSDGGLQGRILPPNPSDGPGIAGIIEIEAEIPKAVTATNPSVNEEFDLARRVNWTHQRNVQREWEARVRNQINQPEAVAPSRNIVPFLAGPSQPTSPNRISHSSSSGKSTKLPPLLGRGIASVYEEIDEGKATRVIKRHSMPPAPKATRDPSIIIPQWAEPRPNRPKPAWKKSQPSKQSGPDGGRYPEDFGIIGHNPNVGHTAVVSNFKPYLGGVAPTKAPKQLPGNPAVHEPSPVQLKVHGSGAKGKVARIDPDDPMSRIDIGVPIPLDEVEMPETEDVQNDEVEKPNVKKTPILKFKLSNQIKKNSAKHPNAPSSSSQNVKALKPIRLKRNLPRLPRNLIPNSYHIEWQPFVDRPEDQKKFLTFDGKITVDIECKEATDQVIMHSKDLYINKHTIVLVESPDEERPNPEKTDRKWKGSIENIGKYLQRPAHKKTEPESPEPLTKETLPDHKMIQEDATEEEMKLKALKSNIDAREPLKVDRFYTETTVRIESAELDTENETLILQLNRSLQAGKRYQLSMKFSGLLGNTSLAAIWYRPTVNAKGWEK